MGFGVLRYLAFQNKTSGPGFPAAAAASNRSVFSGYLTKESMVCPLQIFLKIFPKDSQPRRVTVVNLTDQANSM